VKKLRKFLKKRWVIVLFILILLGGVFWRRQAAQKADSALVTAVVEKKDFVKTISSSGKTKADRSVNLTFQTSGKLAWVGVKEGDTVYAYQGIAGLDAREVQKTLEKTLLDYSKQRNDFEQLWRVTYDGKTVHDTVTDTVKRILEKNQWDLEKAVLDVELRSLAVEYATLVTPIGGIVTHIDTPIAGVNIMPTTAVFSVVDPTSLVFEATVDETDVGSLSLGQKATITLDAFPDSSFSGVISYISYTSVLSSGGATVFPVKISFDTGGNIRIGLNGDVSIETDRSEGALTIPTEALREENDEIFVYKKTDGKYAKTKIVTGLKNEDDIIVTEGLAEGDAVVTKGFATISK